MNRRTSGKDRFEQEVDRQWFALFFPIGIGVGVALGVAMDNIGAGIGVGAGLGIALSFLGRRSDSKPD